MSDQRGPEGKLTPLAATLCSVIIFGFIGFGLGMLGPWWSALIVGLIPPVVILIIREADRPKKPRN